MAVSLQVVLRPLGLRMDVLEFLLYLWVTASFAAERQQRRGEI